MPVFVIKGAGYYAVSTGPAFKKEGPEEGGGVGRVLDKVALQCHFSPTHSRQSRLAETNLLEQGCQEM
jgi:hypothetical protein